ncbi:FK506-binding protein 15 isoform X3 [Myxocyprinus asiaticus]|uniref:FK506-binding protein 15 isoform X3 n=1 Tax=Myxocyprinus asiaticus TaxID=70543 RepID=UPI0022233DCB|nr:FK506-binding protein 15 isoform X3 [Myxocyprinus asiaticus]
MFATDDEDGDFLSPTGGAKLASLFGLDQATSQGNESFQYTAPKQPRKSTTNSGPPTQKSTPPPNSPAVLFATAVHAYRYVNGQYVKQGKLGAAVLGNHTTKEYKILLYVSQQKQVTAARIHNGFILTVSSYLQSPTDLKIEYTYICCIVYGCLSHVQVQPSNYCTFYDDQRQNWSLMFESEKAATDFCKEVCLTKANCNSSLDSVLIQDLLLGEGQGVENGDCLEVAYSGWLLQNHTIGTMFDSNLNKDKLLRLKLGAGKVIKGWDEGMLSMRKGGRRFMVIPPSLAYGSQGVPNRVPPDSTLVFETEIRRIKFAKDGNSRESAAPSPAPSVESLGPSELNQPISTAPPTFKPSEPPLRAKSNSLNEQLSNPDATKAKLISRMAKMGQPMLPFFSGPASSSSQPDSSDSELELEDPSVSRQKEHNSAPSPQPVHITSAPPPSVQAAALLPVAMATANTQPMMPGAVHAFQPVSQMFPTQTVPYQGTSDVTCFLMTEARQHNTEIRLGVSKVADKLDQLSSKIDNLQKQGNVSLGLTNVSMETAMIMHNIQRIIQENECLKKEVFEKSSRIEEQNRKIGELINQNQRYVEQSNLLMEQRNDSLKNSSEQSQARMLQAEQDKARLTEELTSSTARVSELQLELSSQQQNAAVLQTKLNAALQDSQQHSTHITTLEAQLLEFKETAERVQSQYKMEKQKRKELEFKLNNVDEELQDMKTEKDSLERTLSDRKRKWQAERQRCDEELEEVRRAGQQEMDNLRSQLRKARTSTDHASAEQLAQLQADLEQEWQLKCDQTLAAAREQQRRELTELTETRDTMQLKLTQLQEKFNMLKQSRESDEQLLLQQQDQREELQALREKCSVLEQKVVLLKQQGEARVSELERNLAEQQQQTDAAGEVKRVMNGVFQSLRGEFDLNETYTGSAVLTVLVNTIKSVTLQLLTKPVRSASEHSEKEEEEEKNEERESDAQPRHEVHINRRREEEERDSSSAGQDEGQSQAEKKDISPSVEKKDISPSVEKKDISPAVEKIDISPAVEKKDISPAVEKKDISPAVEKIDISPAVEKKEVTDELEKEDRSEQDIVEEKREDVVLEKRENEVVEEKEVEGNANTEQNLQALELDSESWTETAQTGKELSDDITPKQEVKVINESITGPLDETETAQVTLRGPPKNPPPPPPNPLQDDSTKTSAPLSSQSERVEEENGEEPFFQSAAPPQPPPAPTDEEEEELSLKGRPPPAPLFGDDSDDNDDLDWLG